MQAYLVYIWLLKELAKDEYAWGGSGVLYQFGGGSALGCLGHEQERLEFCDVLYSSLHAERLERLVGVRQ